MKAKLLSAPLLAFLSALIAFRVLVRESYLPEEKQINRWMPVDLDVYMLGGKAVSEGSALYAGPFVKDLPFTYPPFAGAMFSFFSALDPKLLTIAWQTTNFIALVAVVLMVFARKRELTPMLGIASLCFATAMFISEPVRANFYYGQINLLLMCLICLDFLPREHRWAGIGVGLAAGLKLTPAFFLLLFVLQRRWRALFVSIAVFSATVAVGFWRVPDASAFWTHAISDSSRVGSHNNPGAQSLRTILIRVFHSDGQGLWLALSLGIVACTAIACVWAIRRDQVAIAVSLCGFAACLVSPFSWFHHWVWVAPAVAGVIVLFDAPSQRLEGWKAWASAQGLLLCALGLSALWLLPTVNKAVAPGIAQRIRGEEYMHDPLNVLFIAVGVVAIIGYAAFGWIGTRRLASSSVE
ncbi:glycosyltransferase 87 family protein [Corynebacterium gerontici]|uniref:glycosyltransferase 87 family protein n=1 Tax=Corynebacterium gerontici TaxID=2079234 RepID=UPI000F4F5829|nr:glycosyltransferase 87 family protein [Corynebacterium gerontici]